MSGMMLGNRDREHRRMMEILLVEDDPASATVTVRALQDAEVPHRLTWLTDGDDAASFLFWQGLFVYAPRPDLVLLDLHLPGTDGREILRLVRCDDDLHSIPIVVLTGADDAETAELCQQHDVERFMTKPVDLPKFKTLVTNLQDRWSQDIIVPQLT